MKASRRKFEELTNVFGIHGAARLAYQATLGRRGADASRKLREFYLPLLPKGSLVFDVGANTGKYAEAFESLGARVVALEPNSDCVRHIELAYRTKAIQVIQAVAGPQNELASIKVSDRRDDISSLSDAWIGTLKSEHQNYLDLWNREVVVPMVTLDSLIKHFGIPHYIKIDVEGFEGEVLDGLSVRPPLLSFEFNLAFLSNTEYCLKKDIFSADCEFNLAFGTDSAFAFNSWRPAPATIMDFLCSMKSEDRHGDIFVRSFS